ncbi:hypothetical protein TVAG_062900 [Trichomonas vaginalis G3]|uniref:F5/8 type C domain-containing protein n=1 Tax=Trichomonas vaginalis (strain ATCC PRA-98 / G3) TaxID=412133 RepID=A2DLQ2_TRIV3|nr:hypothetical protein TVAGG3_0581050 [Trichomonas vaginalis G3]EAY18685.1 hypothetical protein TVAG_062900 [Trichomonas vaginalis G3]KAI5522584.1 hypothetical protein TVAGG3_0581050 [Trichomonas vaginalis G3]|eukprot:XP_001579671.1 hypothetical protein [Trichomonas vaginalis G3]
MDYIASLSDDKMRYLYYESSPGQTSPEQLFYYKDGYSYGTGENTNQYYVGFYLKKHIFDIRSFSIGSSLNPTNSRVHPVTWKLMGSVDEQNWFVIDSHTNDNLLNGFDLKAHIDVQGCLVRHIRFVSPSYFALRYLDFFGNLYPYNFKASPCLVKYYYCQIISLWHMVIPILL